MRFWFSNNIVQEQNSYALADMILNIEENLQCTTPRTITIYEGASRNKREFIPD